MLLKKPNLAKFRPRADTPWPASSPATRATRVRKDRYWAGHAPTPCATLTASVAAIPRPMSHGSITGTGVLRRADSSITIELA